MKDDSTVTKIKQARHRISALMTEDYLTERAKRGKRAKFEKAMAKVADNEAEGFDRL